MEENKDEKTQNVTEELVLYVLRRFYYFRG